MSCDRGTSVDGVACKIWSRSVSSHLVQESQHAGWCKRKVDVRLPDKGISNPHGARPVYLIITMTKWTRTSRLSIKNSLSLHEETFGRGWGSCSQQLSSEYATFRQSRPDFRLGVQVKFFQTFSAVPFHTEADFPECSKLNTGPSTLHVHGYLAHKETQPPRTLP